MIYYQAVCKKHSYQSSLYLRRSDAVRSARRHREVVSGIHNLVILEVFIANSSMDIKSENNLI